MSWIIKNKETGEIITEIFNKSTLDFVNTSKYEIVPIIEHLASLSKTKYNWITGKSITEES